MSSVLYDTPGPRARRRSLIGTVVAAVALLALVAVAVRRLAERGQFDAELWAPWVDPSSDDFGEVWGLVAEGAAATAVAALLAITLSLLVGTALGVGRMLSGRYGRIPIVAFVELFRGLPVVITIVFVWRAMVELDIPVEVLPGEDALWFLVIGLTLYNSVIIAEILRAGVTALPSGQREAGLAIGLTDRQVMRSIQLPQAFRTMMPAIISQLVVVLKDTSLAAVIGLGYRELLDRGNQISQVLDNPIQSLFVVGVLFILVNLALSQLAVVVERRLGTARTTMRVGEDVSVGTGA